MIRFLLFLLFTGALEALEYDLFILAGQSNAQGWAGDARHYPDTGGHLDAGIPLYYEFPKMESSGGKWIDLGPQRGRFRDGHFGPEISFARALTEHGYRPAVFKFALAGSSLDRSWKSPGEGGLYDDMVRSFRKAVAEMERAGHTLRIRALIWIQGEADAIDPGSSARYEENLDALLKDFRSRVARQPKLPVLLGVDEKNPYVIRRPIIVAAQRNIAARDSSILRTSMRGLSKKDRTHLRPSALGEHGERLAAAYLKLDRSKQDEP